MNRPVWIRVQHPLLAVKNTIPVLNDIWTDNIPLMVQQLRSEPFILAPPSWIPRVRLPRPSGCKKSTAHSGTLRLSVFLPINRSINIFVTWRSLEQTMVGQQQNGWTGYIDRLGRFIVNLDDAYYESLDEVIKEFHTNMRVYSTLLTSLHNSCRVCLGKWSIMNNRFIEWCSW